MPGDAAEFSKNMIQELHTLATECHVSIEAAWRFPLEVRRYWIKLTQEQRKSRDGRPPTRAPDGRQVTRDPKLGG